MKRDDGSGGWVGGYRTYDLVKELVIATAVVSLLTVALAVVFSSPDEPQVTVAQWARVSPNDFVATAATELDGTSGSATYGAPYMHDPSAAQKIGPLGPQNWPGVTIPIDAANDFVLGPLRGVSGVGSVAKALAQWDAATPAAQQDWASGYDDALQKASDNDPTKVAPGSYGPVPELLGALTSLAVSGGLDGVLLSQGSFYQTNYTKPLLFLADGTYLEDLAREQHLGGDQWGMMNETGNYPGQPWLWLYTFWYQVKPFSTSGNADALVWGLMMVLTLILVLVPFLPGIRSIPRWSKVHRLIWRDYYRSVEHPRA